MGRRRAASDMSTTVGTLRITVAALMHACGETQTELAERIGITQGQLSRKQSGLAAWSLTDIDNLSTHYGVPVPDLVAGPTHAVSKLDRRRLATVGRRQQVIAV
ncbi:helix-turn-helix domain-containing protein [Streptomyces sp. NPDC059534]|uniref:helix-turn-helix domain-containing protein n=1 Tax=Streptomyces sp. NPDC059534 TaxID=3346859 RepID=UPI0036CEAD96